MLDSIPKYYKFSKNVIIWILIWIFDITSIFESITSRKLLSFVYTYCRSKFKFVDFSLVVICWIPFLRYHKESKNVIIWILNSIFDILSILESITSWEIFSFVYTHCRSKFKFVDFSLVVICWIPFLRYYKFSKNVIIWIWFQYSTY